MIAFTASDVMLSILGRHREIDEFIFTQIKNHSIIFPLSILIFVTSCY